jgi:hypothetical protein
MEIAGMLDVDIDSTRSFAASIARTWIDAPQILVFFLFLRESSRAALSIGLHEQSATACGTFAAGSSCGSDIF